jgi:nitroreductase
VEALETIYGRRSIRHYTKRLVSNDEVLTLLRAAAQAPSAVNLQPWAFSVVQDEARLRRWSDRAKDLTLHALGGPPLPDELRLRLADPEFNIFYDAGTLIVICAKPLGQHPDWDCCLAAQNLMLAAHAMGLGTCVVGLAWGLFERGDVKAELGVPQEYRPTLPIVVGYPAGDEPPMVPARREPEVLKWTRANGGES